MNKKHAFPQLQRAPSQKYVFFYFFYGVYIFEVIFLLLKIFLSFNNRSINTLTIVYENTNTLYTSGKIDQFSLCCIIFAVRKKLY